MGFVLAGVPNVRGQSQGRFPAAPENYKVGFGAIPFASSSTLIRWPRRFVALLNQLSNNIWMVSRFGLIQVRRGQILEASAIVQPCEDVSPALRLRVRVKLRRRSPRPSLPRLPVSDLLSRHTIDGCQILREYSLSASASFGRTTQVTATVQ